MDVRVSIEPIRWRPAAEQRRVLAQSLKIFSAYFRHKVAQRFSQEGPGWPPRQQTVATQQRREVHAKSLAEHRLRRKLERDIRRAKMRLGKGKGTQQSVDRRYAVLKEFERQVRGGTTQPSADKDDRRLQKSVSGLRGRMDRAGIEAASKVLGKLAGSIKAKLGGGELVVSSRVPWAGVHNEGGQVGRGAKIPARPFLFVENEDLEVLGQIMLTRAIASLEDP